MELAYNQGTIVLTAPSSFEPPDWFSWDPRTNRWRALAHTYRDTVKWLKARKVKSASRIERPPRLDLKLRSRYEPYPYQNEALSAWVKAGGRGSIQG